MMNVATDKSSSHMTAPSLALGISEDILTQDLLTHYVLTQDVFTQDVLTQDVLTEETYHLLNEVFSGYMSLFLCLVGVPANVITCLVFWNQGLRDRMNLCLFSLAVVDSLYMAAVVPVIAVGALLHVAQSPVAEEYFLKSLINGIGLVYGLRLTSGCYNVIIALERCLCVVFPLQAATMLSTRAMRVLLAACFCVVQLGYLVIPLQLRVVRADEEGTVHWRYLPTQAFLDHKELFQSIEMSLLTVSLPIITFIVVSVTAVITVIKLTAALKWREKTSSTCNDKVGQQTALTKMILLVSFIYICTLIPSVSLTVTRLLVHEFSASGRYYFLFMGTHIVANVCPLVHSASNFFVYYNRSSRFRSALHALCRCNSSTSEHPLLTVSSTAVKC